MYLKGQYCGSDLANMILKSTNGCNRHGALNWRCVTTSGESTEASGCSAQEECCRTSGCNPIEHSSDEC